MDNKKRKKIRDKLKKSSVGIAGVGGLGSNAAISLARSGVGRIVIVDFDIVEESNLDRQYYFIDQIGEKKVEALRENISKINHQVKVDCFNKRLTKGFMDEYFKDVDVIIEALDSAEMKTNFIEEIMLKLPEIPLVAASGVAGYGHSDRIKTKHMGNLHLVYDEESESSEKDVLLAPRVNLIANWQANLVLEILLGVDE